MNVLDVILAVEQGEVEDEDALIDGLSEHRESLRQLQGSWGRFIQQLEDGGVI